MNHETTDLLPCPLCGKSTFEWGAFARRGTVMYPSFSTRSVWSFFGKPYLNVEARRCVTCNHVDLFARPRGEG